MLEDENDMLKNELAQKDQKIRLVEESLGKKIQSRDKKLIEAEENVLEVNQMAQRVRDKY